MMKLYIYDHCPYCVKARMIFGLRSVDMELITLLNDDVATPTQMIGQKMVPILERDDGSYLPESMDIIHEIDQIDGKPALGKEQSEALNAWLAESRSYLYQLAMPRWVRAPLEEFATEGATAYFTNKKEAMISDFASLMQQTSELKAQAQQHLDVLAPMIHSERSVHASLSEDDIHVFAALRSLSIVAGLEYPDAVEQYRQTMSSVSNVPLHDDIAIQ